MQAAKDIPAMDDRTILTLDAGGTNFVFSAIQGGREAVAPVSLPADTTNLENCLETIVAGFARVQQQLSISPSAISFAFPGPADYRNGVIGNLPNFPCFRHGVALGPFLKERFGLPVFINNDGALFAYGEAFFGALPAINEELRQVGSTRRYKNLIAITLGTGFGCGIMINGVLLSGDNECGGAIWCAPHRDNRHLIAEAGVSIQALQNSYALHAGIEEKVSPLNLFRIAENDIPGNRWAAIRAFEDYGKIAGFTVGQLLGIIDGVVVVGGGISGAYKYILPAMIHEMNSTRVTQSGTAVPGVPIRSLDLMDPKQKNDFLRDDTGFAKLPGASDPVYYQQVKKTGVIVSSLGASKVIALGAYYFALNMLDNC